MDTINDVKVVARNKKAFHDYEIIEKLEVGIVLQGTEIKSVRDGKVNFRDSFVDLKPGEAWLMGFSISPYEFGNIWNHKEDRPRKLLLHRRQIFKFNQKMKERGFTMIPLDIYLKGGKAKMTVALARGKTNYDKRDSLKKKELTRELGRARDKYS